jgi:hypothetical protein
MDRYETERRREILDRQFAEIRRGAEVAAKDRVLVLAHTVESARKAGFPPRRGCTVVTPRNIDTAVRGLEIHPESKVVAVNLYPADAAAMLDHESVAPSWAFFGRPTVEHVSTH